MDKKKKKFDPLMLVVYIGIALCVISYVFTQTTGYLIPTLTPFSLAAAMIAFTVHYYKENRDDKTGMLRSQIIILSFFCAIPVFFGILEIIAVIVGKT